MDKKMHHSYHIENLTDLRVFKKEAEERRDKHQEPTTIHHHSISKNCSDNAHTTYYVDGVVIHNEPAG